MNARRVAAPGWLKLDNAAKIYPAARTRGWMPMFRVSVTLKEEVDENLLNAALQQALARVPMFAYRLRQGLFWHFFERQDRAPRVEPDARNPMLPINLTRGQGFQFRLRLYKRRVALEVFHALTDGHGATAFLLTILNEYIFLKYGRRFEPVTPMLDPRKPPQKEEWEDAFPRFARKTTSPRSEEAAWQMKGIREDWGFLRVITGITDTDKLLALARSHGTTINTLLAALFLQALLRRKAESKRGRHKPVKLSLPINLRKYYGSQTLRNFSFYVNVPLRSDFGEFSLEDLIVWVSHYMGLETLEPQLNARFSLNVKAEQNRLLRIAPLLIKNLVLKLMYIATGERYMTSTLTNVGLISLPPGMEDYVQRMDLVLGPAQKTPLAAAVISCAGQTSISFSSTIKNKQVERDFFTSLIKMGLPVLIESN